MMKTCQFLLSTLVLPLLLFVLPSTGWLAAHAQVDLPSAIQILTVDTTNYPQMEVAIGGVNWPETMDGAPVELTLNDQRLSVEAEQSAQRSIQLALAVDANQLANRNISGQSGYVEMTGTLLDLVEANVFIRDEDWLAAFQLQGNTKPLLLQDWTQEPNLIFNRVVDSRPPEVDDAPLTAAPLIDLITQMVNHSDSGASRRVLLLFSTGTTITDLTPVIEAAQAARVAIHAIELLGATGTQQSDTLQQLAIQSGGHYTALSSPELSTDVGNAIMAAHTVRLLQVRADTASPQSLGVTVTLPDNRTLDATVGAEAFADMTVAPVQVTVVNPVIETISWNELATGDDPTTRLLPIKANLTWGDGYPRELLQVSYTLRGPAGFAQQEIRTEAPFDQATLPLDTPQDGGYSLEIRALDELALEADVAAITIRFTDLPLGEASQPEVVANSQVVANEAGQSTETERNASTVAASPATDAVVAGSGSALNPQSDSSTQASDTILIPGLQVAVPRALLVWSLPVLLLLIGYLIYSERRDRRRRQQVPQGSVAQQPFSSSSASDPQFDLRNDFQPVSGDAYQLDAAGQNHTMRYTMNEDDALVKVGTVDHRSAQRDAEENGQERLPTLPDGNALVWDDDDDFADEITIAPVRMEDAEATYRVQDVARPIVGFLMRTTSDPNLPKELPIYGLQSAPGELRQIYIGRHSKHNTVVINDKRISREHAVLVQRDGRLYLRDNASTAGTFLNWKRLNPGEELLLRHNDLISFGEVAYEFRAQGEDEATVHNG